MVRKAGQMTVEGARRATFAVVGPDLVRTLLRDAAYNRNSHRQRLPGRIRARQLHDQLH